MSSPAKLDLLNQDPVHEFLADERRDYFLIDAAKVGGIHDKNACRADSLYQALIIKLLDSEHVRPLDRRSLAAAQALLSAVESHSHG